jgi:hypothetical protein
MKRYFAVAALVAAAGLAASAQPRPRAVEKDTTVLGFNRLVRDFLSTSKATYP